MPKPPPIDISSLTPHTREVWKTLHAAAERNPAGATDALRRLHAPLSMEEAREQIAHLCREGVNAAITADRERENARANTEVRRTIEEDRRLAALALPESPAAPASDVEVLDADGEPVLSAETRERWLADLSEGREFDEGLAAHEIAAHYEAMAGHAIRIGRRLLWAKLVMSPAAFWLWCEDAIGLQRAQVYTYLGGARLVMRKPELAGRLSGLGVRKLNAALGLSEKDREDLLANGLLLGKKVDVDGMSARELEKEIRAAKKRIAQLEAECQEHLAEKERVRGELHARNAKLADLTHPTPQGERELRAKTEQAFLEFTNAAIKLGNALRENGVRHGEDELAGTSPGPKGEPPMRARCAEIAASAVMHLCYERLVYERFAGLIEESAVNGLHHEIAEGRYPDAVPPTRLLWELPRPRAGEAK